MLDRKVLNSYGTQCKSIHVRAKHIIMLVPRKITLVLTQHCMDYIFYSGKSVEIFGCNAGEQEQ